MTGDEYFVRMALRLANTSLFLLRNLYIQVSKFAQISAAT